MPETTSQLMHQAIAAHKTGDLQQAQSLCQKVLAQNPQHANANNLLGVIIHQLGDSPTAVQLLIKATQLNPNLTDAYKLAALIQNLISRNDEALCSDDCPVQSILSNGVPLENPLKDMIREGRLLTIEFLVRTL